MYEVHQQQPIPLNGYIEGYEETYLDEDVVIQQYPEQEAKIRLTNIDFRFSFPGLQPENDIIIPINFNLNFRVVYSVPNDFHTNIKSFQLKEDDNIMHSFSAISVEKNRKIYRILVSRIFEDGFHEQYKGYKGQNGELTQGAFAKVFLVTRNETKIKYFVKAFSKKSFQNKQKYPHGNGQQAVLHEINILKKLNCKRLMKLQRAYSSENSVYMVNELIKGQNFLKVHEFRGGNFTEKQVFFFMKGVLEALLYLSQKRIFHRDIKPQNILLRNEKMENPVLVDFGLADYCDSSKYCFTIGGTFGYVAPEILQNQDALQCHFQPVCDIFSLGILFFVLLRKRPLFIGQNQRQLYRANKTYNNQYLQQKINGVQMNESAKNLLRRMLEANPDHRITAAEALQHQYFDQEWQNIQQLVDDG